MNTWHRKWVVAMVLMLPGGLLFAQDSPKAKAWNYVSQAGPGLFARPVMTALPLTAQRPEQMTEKVKYRGRQQRYAQIRYGSENSVRVIVVVDEISRQEFDLYVDRDRNRFIDKEDLVPGTGRTRVTPLKVHLALGTDRNEYIPQVIALRRGITGRSISVGTAGYVQGHARLAGKTVAVRRVDGDANGLFADVADRLWVERDGDGQWDPVTELFPYMPILRLDQRRFAVRGDRAGRRLAFEEIVGTGRVSIHLPMLAKTASVEQLEVMLFGDDGSAYVLRDQAQPAELPVGRYAVGSVTLSLSDGKQPEPWNFVFTQSGGGATRVWYEVRRDASVKIDPIGKLRFELNPSDAGKPVRPGQSLSLSPRMYTGDGLLINSSSCGKFDRFASEDKHNCARIRLCTADKTVVASARSGFA